MESSTTTAASNIITDQSSISRYNRGPITRAFIPPTSCLSTLTLNAEAKSLYFGFRAELYVDPSCYPLGTMARSDLVSGPPWFTYYYSPAVCPYGWTQATTFTSTSEGGAADGKWLSICSGTTAALCCPSQYSYMERGHICSSSLTRDQVIRYIFATLQGAQGWDPRISTSTIASNSFVAGDGIPIWWQSSDIALLASASSALLSPPITTTDAALTATRVAQTSRTVSIPSSTSTRSSESGGLKRSQKIGIGVGVPLFLIAALLIGYLVFRRHRNKRRHGGAYTPGIDDGSGIEVNMASENCRYDGMQELPAAIGSDQKRYHDDEPQELPGTFVPHEIMSS